uniref:alanine--tRNA ligase n=3 Tax=Meloidogyne TaxID=189290 RepID=A0A914M0Y5_MELIC
MNSSKYLRELFMQFFISRSHLKVPSGPVIVKHNLYNQSDFTCAGVQQFIPILVGEQEPPAKRLVNSQKCIRLNDKDLVGYDDQHHTFFEMLGNWSFGDCSKAEALQFVWEFLTQTLSVNPSHLYTTYFGGNEIHDADTETRDIWQMMGVPNTHLFACNAERNLWSLGDIGPFGTCTEIHFDRRMINSKDKKSKNNESQTSINFDSPHLMELWNIVFMKYNRHRDGRITFLSSPLIVDTGMGLERLCTIMQNCNSTYETDLFQPLINRMSELSPHSLTYQGRWGHEDSNEKDTAFRIVSDHIRTIVATFAEGLHITSTRKYARKIKDLFKKTAIISNTKLGLERGSLAKLVPLVTKQLGDAHPDLRINERNIIEKVANEERRLWAQQDEGFKHIENILGNLARGGTVPGDCVYELIYKNRIDLDSIKEYVKNRGFSIDESRFLDLAENRRRKQRKEDISS